MTDELQKIWKAVVLAYRRWICLEVLRETTIAGVLAEFRTEYFASRRLERCLCMNRFDIIFMKEVKQEVPPLMLGRQGPP